METVSLQADSLIPGDYEAAIGSHKESIIWQTIKIDTHNYVCDLVGLESTLFEALSLLCNKVSLLDEEALRKKQIFDKYVMQHKIYTSSVSAVDTILAKVLPLRTSRARQDKFDACPCINSSASAPLSMCCVCVHA